MNEKQTQAIVNALIKDGTIKMEPSALASIFSQVDLPGYQFRGVCTPGQSPGSVSRPAMFVTPIVGRYSGFSNQSVDVGQIAIFVSADGAFWTKYIAYDGGNGGEDAPTESKEYFTIEATQDGTTVYFRQSSYAVDDGIDPLKVEVSTDGGSTWTEITAAPAEDDVPGATVASLDAGEKVLIRGNNSAYGYYSSSFNDAIENCNFWSDQPCYVYGNIMSLVSSDDFDSLSEVEPYAFAYFFSDCDEALDWSWVLVNESNELLLPATTIAEYCYYYMFHGCASLTVAPDLPATTLADGCYGYMFQYCTSLTSAPSLPAITLADYCYISMFQGCTNLSYIKALFTTTPSNTYTDNWVSGVKATGTFVKSSSATWDVTGDNGVPSGWTVETE